MSPEQIAQIVRDNHGAHEDYYEDRLDYYERRLAAMGRLLDRVRHDRKPAPWNEYCRPRCVACAWKNLQNNPHQIK